MNCNQLAWASSIGITLYALFSAFAWAQSITAAESPGEKRTHEKKLNEIIVTADPLGRLAHDPVQPVEIMAGAELEDQRRSTIGETVAQQMGVQSSYFGPGVGRPIIRGLDGARVQILAGGAAALDASTVSVDHAVTVEPFLADQIEIMKGPATLFYGSGAIGGVVNVVDSRIPESGLDGTSGRAELGADTGADGRSGMVRLDIGNVSGAFHLDGFQRKTSNFEAPGTHDGEIENSALETKGGAIGGTMFGKHGFVGASLSSFATLYGIPNEEEEESLFSLSKHEGEELVRIDMEQTRFDAKAGWFAPMPGIEKLIVKFAQNNYQHTELEGSEIGTVFNVDAYEGRFEFTHATVKQWDGVFGLQISDRELEAIGAEAFIPASTTQDWGVFFVERKTLDPFSIELGGRYDHQRVKTMDVGSISHDALSVSLSSAWAFSEGWSLIGNYDRAQRAPSAEELLSLGPHLATQTFEVGNARLKEETANQIELGLHFDLRDTHVKLSAYHNHFNDFIYLENTSEIEEELPVRQWSQSDAQFRGFEGEVQTLLSDTGVGRFDLRVFGDTVDAELNSGANLPRIAPARLGAGLNWALDGWRAAVSAIRYSKQKDVAEFETETAGYALLNANLSYAFNSTLAEWEIFADGSNLTDREARIHTSFLKEVAPLPGRNFRFGIRAFF